MLILRLSITRHINIFKIKQVTIDFIPRYIIIFELSKLFSQSFPMA